jgi:type II secretory pathway pseudopilin PulG
MTHKGLTLLEVIMIIVVIVILAGLFIPAIGPGHGCGQLVSCQCNLSQLYRLQIVYSKSNAGAWPPTAKGADFWLSLCHTKPPLVDESTRQIFACPVRDEECGPDKTHFRGPALPFGKLGIGDPLGADKEGNHGEHYGGNVLRKDGGVIEVPSGDKLWKQCRDLLQP